MTAEEVGGAIDEEGIILSSCGGLNAPTFGGGRAGMEGLRGGGGGGGDDLKACIAKLLMSVGISAPLKIATSSMNTGPTPDELTQSFPATSPMLRYSIGNAPMVTTPALLPLSVTIGVSLATNAKSTYVYLMFPS